MTEEEKLDRKGFKVFEKLDAEDKRALKRFLTGQIQNILVNEHGIGGQRKDLEAARLAASRTAVEKIVTRESYLEMIGKQIVQLRRTDVDRMIREAVDKAAADAVAAVVGAAASRISVKIFVEPELPTEAKPDNFAKF